MFPGMINRHFRNITLTWPGHSFLLSNFPHPLDKETHEKASPTQAKDIYHFKEEYKVYSCRGTTSFGAICEFKNKTETNKQKKPVRTVAYLLLLSNISQEILPGMASVFYSFYFYLPEKYIS